jgi:hypothetical protein
MAGYFTCLSISQYVNLLVEVQPMHDMIGLKVDNNHCSFTSGDPKI